MPDRNRSHPSEDMLIAFAEHGNDPLVQAHLAECADCAEVVSDYRAIAAAASDEDTWHLVDQMVGGGLEKLRQIQARREAEDAEAHQMLDPILTSPFQFAYANILRRRRYYTGGVVRLLCETAWDQLDRDPRYAKTLAETAGVIAEALPDDYYPANAVEDLRGTAWLYYASACGSLARFQDGYEALTRAKRAFERLPDGGTQIGRVEMTRATLLIRQWRNDEALVAARAAAERFEFRGDDRRYHEAKECEAAVLMRLGDVNAARETFERVYRVADTVGEPETKARAANNLAISCREAGDIHAASRYFLEALQYYSALGQEAMVVHIRWSIARLALWFGNAAQAAQVLPQLIAELNSRDLVRDASFARLDLVETMLVLERFDDAYAECCELVEFFSNAEILTGGLTAMAFMKEAAARRTLTVPQVRAVQKYVKALTDSPHLLFAVPDERDTN